MIYLLYGDDAVKSRAVLRKFRERFLRETGSAWRHIDCEDEDAVDRLATELGGQSLFSKKDYIIVEHASALPEKLVRTVEEMLARWQGEDSVIVFYERGTPRSKLFKKIFEVAHKKEEFRGPGMNARKVPDERELFSLGDAWGRRERTKSVALFEHLVSTGFEPESILRTLLWHIKNLALVSHKKAKEISSPFVARKATEQARNFKIEDIDGAYFKLLSISDPRGKDFLETRLLEFLLKS